jgi:hypothetical protein
MVLGNDGLSHSFGTEFQELVSVHILFFVVKEECDRLFHDRVRILELASPDLFADSRERFGLKRDLHAAIYRLQSPAWQLAIDAEAIDEINGTVRALTEVGTPEEYPGS